MFTSARALLRPGLPVLLSLALVACGGGDDGGGGGDGGGDGGDGDGIASYAVTGTVVDFASGLAIEGQATVTTAGIAPPPTVSVTGADFEIARVPPGSVFNVLAGSPPDYRNTYGEAVEVVASDVDGVVAHVVSEAYLAAAASAFGVTPSSTTGVLFARAVDANGAALPGVPANAFELGNAAPLAGPFFLDADLQPAPALAETSASGYVLFFEVSPGLTAVNAAADSGLTMTMSASPVSANAVTLAAVQITDGQPVVPENVSFRDDVLPVFSRRGCTACHSGGGIGKDLGGLTLDGSEKKAFSEITEELSPNYAVTRVNLASPPESLLLTLPSAEDPPDAHPNITFASPNDPDYLTLLVWIEEGALLD